MKKKIWYQNIKNWMWIVGVPSLFGVIVLTAKTITTYAELPQEVEETQGDVNDIKKYISQQQAINDFYYKKEQREERVIYSPDGYYYWDESYGDWLPVEER